MNFVAYYRVSTKKQGESGLGLQSQQDRVRSYIESVNGTLIKEFMEVESGGNTQRKYLTEAIAMASKENATIVVKKMDRLSRDGFKVSTMLEELGIPYIDCESPNDTGFIKNIKLAIAKDEKEKIGERITSALGVIKDNIERDGYHISKKGNRITSLGNIDNLGGDMAIERSKAVRRAKALSNENNRKAKAVIKMMRGNGSTLQQIVDFLNGNGFKTSRGNDFSKVQVSNLLNY